MDDPYAREIIILPEYAVANRTAENQRICSRGLYYLLVLPYHLPGLIRAARGQHRPSAAYSAVPVHPPVVHPGFLEQGFDAAPYPWRQLGHAAGKIQDLPSFGLVGEGSRVDRGVVLGQSVLPGFPLGYSQGRSFDPYLADCLAFAAKQAFVADFFNPAFVPAPDLAVEINRAVLDVGFLDAHRTCVDAESAVGAAQHFHLCESLPGVPDPQAGVAKRD